MEPVVAYEREGSFGNVIFSNGQYSQWGRLRPRGRQRCRSPTREPSVPGGDVGDTGQTLRRWSLKDCA